MVQEKRSETRRTAHGAAMVRFNAPKPFVIHGRLVDISAGGFRLTHEYRSLEPGQVVDYSHGEGAGRARVVWNRITSQRVETGFVVLNG